MPTIARAQRHRILGAAARYRAGYRGLWVILIGASILRAAADTAGTGTARQRTRIVGVVIFDGRAFWLGGQTSDCLIAMLVSYVGLLDLLHGLVLRRRIGVLPVGILRRHVEHQINGLVVKTRRFRSLSQPIQLLPLFRRIRIRRTA